MAYEAIRLSGSPLLASCREQPLRPSYLKGALCYTMHITNPQPNPSCVSQSWHRMSGKLSNKNTLMHPKTSAQTVQLGCVAILPHSNSCPLVSCTKALDRAAALGLSLDQRVTNTANYCIQLNSSPPSTISCNMPTLTTLPCWCDKTKFSNFSHGVEGMCQLILAITVKDGMQISAQCRCRVPKTSLYPTRTCL